MLNPVSRIALLAMSTVCVAGVVVLAPARVRGSGATSAIESLATANVRRLIATVPNLDVRRDPFAEPMPQTTPATAAAPALPVQGPAATLAPPGIGTLPSNLSTSTIPLIPGQVPNSSDALRVTAIVTGSRPYAMIDIAGDHQIKGIGDRVDNRSIVAIDMNGVTLQGGARLTVTPGDLPQ